MVLNYIWIGFVLIAIVVAMVAAFVTGSADPLTSVMNATFDSAKTGFEISLGLTGVLSLWLGIMKIGEKGGVVNAMSRLVAPFFCKIFPEVPKNHPAMGSMFMNMSANMLGLDNAATPLGLKAMHELQELNPKKDTATNPMIMFLVLNTSGLVIVPISIMVYRAQLGAANPSDVFLPILLATYFATLAGLIAVSVAQKINLFQKTILLTLLGLTLLIVGVIVLFSQLSKEEIQFYSAFVANFLLLSIIALFLISGIRKKINVYEAFIEGAKEGFKVAVGIIPYLVAILVGIGMFRASGAMDFVVVGIEKVFAWAGFNTDFVGALPTALMKPLSGSGSRGMMIDAMKMYGADSFVGRLSCLVQGSTDTTFYILAVYFGSVGISKMRHAVVCGLIADFVGAFAAICIGYLFFH
ncbi:MAG: Spore maturation protein B [Bacteroidetes bacterium ADurb.Bin057]|jgi:spore maturation protein SpmA|nr:MAG: Spore maturation protein B [Bacteroidetes bacterium ADurb.Bin057]HPH72442.1 nucleoside recognition domain-containing protein [Paludibacteraceae bacterium]